MAQYEADVLAVEMAELMTNWHLCDPDQSEGMRGRMESCKSLIKGFKITREEMTIGFNNINLASILASTLTEATDAGQ